jgi:hypothetical protein
MGQEMTAEEHDMEELCKLRTKEAIQNARAQPHAQTINDQVCFSISWICMPHIHIIADVPLCLLHRYGYALSTYIHTYLCTYVCACAHIFVTVALFSNVVNTITLSPSTPSILVHCCALTRNKVSFYCISTLS